MTEPETANKESPLKSLSETEWKAVLNEAEALIMEDEEVNLLATCMINAPRIYQLARFALRREMEKRGHKWESGLEEMILQVTQHQSRQEFNRQEVLRISSTANIRFLQQECTMEAEELRKQQEQEEEAERQQLREKRIRLALNYPPTRVIEASRGEVVVLAGDARGVELTFDTIKAELAQTWSEKDAANIVRVLDLRAETMPNALFPKLDLGTKRVVNLGVNHWVAMANKGDGVSETLLPFFNRFVDRRVDLTFIRDGFQLYTAGIGSVHPLFSVRDAIKRLRKWADEFNVLCVVGVGYADLRDKAEFDSHLDKLLSPHYTVIRVDQ